MKIMVLIVLVFVVGLIGNKDLEEQEAAKAEYCSMVEAGHWPDYDQKFNCEVKA